MSARDKLIARFLSIPADFTYDETVRLLSWLGFQERSGSGSRRSFYHPGSGDVIYLHEPHPGSIMKLYQLRDIRNYLKERGYL